jgi:ATP-dependent exoDNAse (exonuclease V) beta subunit
MTDTASHRADAGLAWGTLIHGLLKHAMRHTLTNATRTDLRRLATWLTFDEPQLRAVLDEAVDTVLEVSRSEFWQRALSCERSVETPFLYCAGEHVIVSGVVDLMFHHEKSGTSVTIKRTLNPRASSRRTWSS